MRKIRRQKIIKYGILLSYDPYNDGSGVDHGWLETLLDEGKVSYDSDSWYAKDAYEGMSVYIYEKNRGIVAGAQIVKPMNNDEGIIGATDKDKYPYEIDRPILLKALREKGIITKNPPQGFQYLSEEDCKKIESLLESEIEEIE